MDSTRFKVIGVVIFVCCLWLIQGYLELLEFNRQQILSGEIWRIWTGHIVHSNFSHFSLNIVAALILYFAFYSKIKIGDLLLYGFVFAALISITLLCFYQNLAWYNGLSGLLHALVAFYSIRLARDQNWGFFAGLVIVWVKVLAEASGAYSGYDNLPGNITIITEAHLTGAIIGTVAALIYRVYRRGDAAPEENQIKALY